PTCSFSFCSILLSCLVVLPSFFFFSATPTTVIYTLSLHDALPIYDADGGGLRCDLRCAGCLPDRAVPQQGHHFGLRDHPDASAGDRKSTRLNSSHVSISYAVFCLKKKNI